VIEIIENSRIPSKSLLSLPRMGKIETLVDHTVPYDGTTTNLDDSDCVPPPVAPWRWLLDYSVWVCRASQCSSL
jgi:hypothetical protein